MFTLVYFLIYFVVLALGYMLHATFIADIFGLAMLVPIIALTTRRLHDINRSGWWQLLNFIPVIGWIILFIWYVTDSHVGSNQYGENPKEQTA